MNNDGFPPGALAAWQQVQQRLLDNPQFREGWPAATLRALRLVGVQREATGHVYVLVAPPAMQAGADRLHQRLHRELLSSAPTGYYDLALGVAEEPPDVEEEPEEAPPEDYDEEVDADGEPLLEDSGLVEQLHEAIQDAHASALAKERLRPTFKSRPGGEPWRWFATSAYEAIFWAAYLGRAFPLWQTLRAYQEAALPPPSDGDLSEILAGAGKRDSRSTLATLLARLREEELVAWQDGPNGREYIVRRELPLLTPHQMKRLSKKLQDDHRERWLQPRHLMRRWEKARGETFVPRLVAERVVVLPRAASQ